MGGLEISPWLKEEVIEARNKLVSSIQISEYLMQPVDFEYVTSLSLLRQSFPLVDSWADELRQSRQKKE